MQMSAGNWIILLFFFIASTAINIYTLAYNSIVAYCTICMSKLKQMVKLLAALFLKEWNISISFNIYRYTWLLYESKPEPSEQEPPEP
jgi:hypothetical protein